MLHLCFTERETISRIQEEASVQVERHFGNIYQGYIKFNEQH